MIILFFNFFCWWKNEAKKEWKKQHKNTNGDCVCVSSRPLCVQPFLSLPLELAVFKMLSFYCPNLVMILIIKLEREGKREKKETKFDKWPPIEFCFLLPSATLLTGEGGERKEKSRMDSRSSAQLSSAQLGSSTTN